MAIILASGSTRRKELLQYSAITIKAVCPANIVEKRNPHEAPLEYCSRLAREKAEALDIKGEWILAADTIVAVENDVFEKPESIEHAIEILEGLSGGWHQVISAWTLRYAPQTGEKECIRSGYSISDVRFRNLERREIEAYVSSGESMDKAGAYGIQGIGACLVAEIKGSYSNIVGLPLEEVLEAIREEVEHVN